MKQILTYIFQPHYMSGVKENQENIRRWKFGYIRGWEDFYWASFMCYKQAK